MSVSVDTGRVFQTAMEQHRAGDLGAAERGYRQILQLQPKHADALHLLGVIQGDRGNLDDGIELIRRALRLAPDLIDAHYNIAMLYVRKRQFADAERHYRRVVTLQPERAMAWNNLGGVLLEQQRYVQASEAFGEALARDPHLTSALNNYAIACEVEGRYDAVIPAYDRVLALDPGNINAHYYRALSLLSRERLAEGWAEYVWRWRRPDTAALHGRYPLSYWAGEDVRGKRILVWTEQGPGDEVMIASMVPDLISRGAEVRLLASRRMAPLFRRAFPTATVLIQDDPADMAQAADGCVCQASLSELGRSLRPDLAAFTQRRSFLSADPERASALRRKYHGAADGPRLVGISWRSSNAGLAHEKTIDLAAWAPILEAPGNRFVNLQYGDSAQEATDVGRRLGVELMCDPSINALHDLDGFAAQVAAMDLVISVSNTTVHFAGALGVPTWTLLPAARGRLWYWFLNRTDSP